MRRCDCILLCKPFDPRPNVRMPSLVEGYGWVDWSGLANRSASKSAQLSDGDGASRRSDAVTRRQANASGYLLVYVNLATCPATT
jgi:hypothetical protein